MLDKEDEEDETKKFVAFIFIIRLAGMWFNYGN